MSREKQSGMERACCQRRLYAKNQKQEIVWLVLGTADRFL